MRRSVLILLARQVVSSAFKNKAMLVLMGILAVLFLYAAYSGFTAYQ